MPDRWSIRGVSEEAQKVAKVRSAEEGVTIGRWVSEVIEAQAKGVMPSAARPKSGHSAVTGETHPVEKHAKKRGKHYTDTW